MSVFAIQTSRQLLIRRWLVLVKRGRSQKPLTDLWSVSSSFVLSPFTNVQRVWKKVKKHTLSLYQSRFFSVYLFYVILSNWESKSWRWETIQKRRVMMSGVTVRNKRRNYRQGEEREMSLTNSEKQHWGMLKGKVEWDNKEATVLRAKRNSTTDITIQHLNRADGSWTHCWERKQHSYRLETMEWNRSRRESDFLGIKANGCYSKFITSGALAFQS